MDAGRERSLGCPETCRRGSFALSTETGTLLVRTNVSDPLPTPEFHGQKLSGALLDGSGQTIRHTDYRYDGNVECVVARVDGAPGAITDCGSDSGMGIVGTKDVATVYAFDSPSGSLASKTVKGGDNSSSYTTLYEDDRGYLTKLTHSGMNWDAVARSVDPATGHVLDSTDSLGLTVFYSWDARG